MSQDNTFKASQDIFEDSITIDENSPEKPNASDKNIVWRGVDIEDLKLNKYEIIPSVIPSSFHAVGFKLPMQPGKCPAAHPRTYQDVWDDNHVQMPCSNENFIQVSETERISAWRFIKERLTKNISSSTDLQQAILSYAQEKGGQRWNFVALHSFFSKTLSAAETEFFFDSVLPGIIDLALSLDREVTFEMPLLKKHKSFNVSITQRQAACLLANAFLCTFSKRNFAKESFPFPAINFTRLFVQGGEMPTEKLKCFINYFRRICNSDMDGVISFSRRSINPSNLPKWFSSNKRFPLLHVTSEGKIDDDGNGMLQIDFANRFIGGGVLGYGCVQEEITFLLCPELVVSRLFSQCLDDTECLVITGAERFNSYSGYGDSFKWTGNYNDQTPHDSYNRRCRTIVAIDALHFRRDTTYQYKPEAIFREINKAYTGFSFGSDGKDKISIATGNWGCGAFRGDPKLKSLIQLIAAAQSERNLAYFTFFDNDLRDNIFLIYSFLVKNNITVGQLCLALNRYHIYQKKGIHLYDYLYNVLLHLDDVLLAGDSFEDKCEEESSSSYNKASVRNEIKKNDSVNEESNCKESTSHNDSHNAEDFVMDIPPSDNQPMTAETYSLETEEGRKRCIASENERWKAYESAKTLLTPNSESSSKVPVKKKISDYFNKTPKRT